MREAGIGRVLVASLHQGIADILPTRLGFYENWLNAEGLREGTIGLAPLYAVLSFLRQEGDAYQLITTRAGEYAAEWTVQSMPPVAARDDQGGAGVAAQPAAAAAGAAAGAQQLHGQPRDLRACAAARPASTCARRSSARCASRSRIRCAASTRPRSRGCWRCSTSAPAREVVACRGTGETDLRAEDGARQRSAGRAAEVA